MHKPCSEEEIFAIPNQHAAGASEKDPSHRYGVAENTVCRWKAQCGAIDLAEARRRRNLEQDSRKLSCLLAEAELDKAA